jgi:dCMP deaminase
VFTEVFTEKELRYHRLYIDIAYRVAEMSFCTRRKVGAIAVTPHNGNIIGFGFNGTPAGECNDCEDESGNTLPSVIHAEENLIKKVTEYRWKQDIDLYVTTRPCSSCAAKLTKDRYSRIKRVFYREGYDRDAGAGLIILKEYDIEVIQMTQ